MNTDNKAVTELVRLSPEDGYASTDMNVLVRELNVILPRLGEEFYRHSYDLAFHLRSALNKAGYNIVRKRKPKTLVQLAGEGKL